MEIMDLFRDDAFGMVSMTAAVNLQPYQPDFLGSLGIFTPAPIRTIDAAVAKTDAGNLRIIPTTERGAPPVEQTTPGQSVQSFRTPRIAIGDTITVAELQGILARAAMMGINFDLVLQDMASEVAYRIDGPNGMRAKVEATKERMRLGALQGQVLDQDDSVIYDWPTLLGASLPAEIDFNLDAASPVPGVLTTAIRQLERSILRAAKAGNNTRASVLALCGDAFFDAFVTHPDVMASYQTFIALQSARLNNPSADIRAFSVFNYADIDWVNYRGTDDNTTIKLDTNKVKFVVRNVPGLFQEVLAPAEFEPFYNQPGLPIYSLLLQDPSGRRAYVRAEMYSYPMYICTRPETLFRGKLT